MRLLLIPKSGRRTVVPGRFSKKSFLKCNIALTIITIRSDDDENEFGRPIYKAKNDPELPDLIKKRDELIEKHK